MSDVSHDGVRMVALQIDDYGPWTTTPEPRRETDLQALQSRLFATVADFFTQFDGYAFADRYDNMIGVANESDPTAFERLQTQIENQYPVTVSVGVGTAETPRRALEAANSVLQRAGSAQDADRTAVLDHRTVGDTVPGAVTVAHFDVVDATGTLTDQVSSAEAGHTIRRAALDLREQLWERYDAVTQFVGGDNVIAVCPSLTPSTLGEINDHVREATGVELQVGLGRGPTAHAAGDDAKHALEHCRATGERIHAAFGLVER